MERIILLVKPGGVAQQTEQHPFDINLIQRTTFGWLREDTFVITRSSRASIA